MGVDYLTQEDIEAKASALLAEYRERFGDFAPPVVPVDEILESLLGFTLRFGEVKSQWGAATQGATSMDEKTVWIDVSLEPDSYPEQEGAYRFTVAHEIGHWVLHRTVVTAPGARLAHVAPTPATVAPTWGSARKGPCDRIEHQANRFAGALLMPADWVRGYWREFTGDDAPRDVTGELARLKEQSAFGPAWEPTTEVARDMAAVFRVSGFSMQIRLKRLGLLTETPPPAPTIAP